MHGLLATADDAGELVVRLVSDGGSTGSVEVVLALAPTIGAIAIVLIGAWLSRKELKRQLDAADQQARDRAAHERELVARDELRTAYAKVAASYTALMNALLRGPAMNDDDANSALLPWLGAMSEAQLVTPKPFRGQIALALEQMHSAAVAQAAQASSTSDDDHLENFVVLAHQILDVVG